MPFPKDSFFGPIRSSTGSQVLVLHAPNPGSNPQHHYGVSSNRAGNNS